MDPPLVWGQAQRSGSHPVFFRHMDHFTCQHVVEISVWNTFFTEKLSHAQTVHTWPFLLKGPVDKAIAPPTPLPPTPPTGKRWGLDLIRPTNIPQIRGKFTDTRVKYRRLGFNCKCLSNASCEVFNQLIRRNKLPFSAHCHQSCCRSLIRLLWVFVNIFNQQ